MHTFREFQVLERSLKAASCVLIDNAALPKKNAKFLLSPCRKGKILVPYLLASARWEVHGLPTAGDSMVSAFCHERTNFADPSYERSEYCDPWESVFDKHLR